MIHLFTGAILKLQYIIERRISYAQNQREQNKPKITNDFASQIAEKQESIASITSEIASITANMDSLKAELKTKRTALKSVEKEVGKLQAKKS